MGYGTVRSGGRILATGAGSAGVVRAVAAGAALVGGMLALRLHSYLLFHGVAEMFSVVVACGIFVIAWNARRLHDNGCFLLLGVGYLFVGTLDLVHALAYEGMGVFRGGGADLPTQLWMAGRFVEAATLLLAPLLVGRAVRALPLLGGFTAGSGLLGGLIFAGAFPSCFSAGGLTAFKIAGEYAVCVAFAASILLLLRRREAFAPGVLRLLVASVAVSIVGEMAFTLYSDVYGAMNFAGHALKIVSFLLIYKGVIETALARPYELLFRDLAAARDALEVARNELERRVAKRTAELAEANRRLTDEVRRRAVIQRRLSAERRRLFSVLQMLPGYVALAGPDYRFRYVNDRFRELFGEPDGRRCHEQLRGRAEPCPSCPATCVVAPGRGAEWEWDGPGGRRAFRTWAYPFTDTDGTPLTLELGVDITERRRLEAEVLRAAEAEKERIGRDLHDSLGQTLSGLSCLSAALHGRLEGRSAPEAADAARIQALLAESVDLTRSLARGLDPVGLQADGLVPALADLASSLEEVYGGRCELVCSAPIELEDPVVARHLYRIAQEAASNAFRHGLAGRVSIRLAGGEEQVRLEVLDDGVGLPSEPRASGGMGIRIMRYRADAMGAELHIAPRPAGGTAVVCRLRRPVATRR